MPYISNPPRANIICANGFGSELATDLLPETSCSPPLSPSPPVTPLFSTQGLELITVSAKQKTSLTDESLSRSGAGGAFLRKLDTSQRPPLCAALSLRNGRRTVVSQPRQKTWFGCRVDREDREQLQAARGRLAAKAGTKPWL